MLLSGKDVAAKEKKKIAEEAERRTKAGCQPCLAILRVGENEPDIAYENRVRKNGEELGIRIQVFEYPGDISQAAFLAEVERMNEDDAIHGMLIFRPLPGQLDEEAISRAVAPEKDADCMNPIQLQRLLTGEAAAIAPCTPEAVLSILKHYEIPMEGKRVAIVNRSLVLGKPLALLFLQENATVTICHSKTTDLKSILNEADIVVTGIGKGRFFGPDYFSEKATVIDVGINFIDGKMCGDVDFDAVCHKAAAITPVPGGVGAVTSAILLKHVLR